MIQIVALLSVIACLFGAAWIAAKRWLPGPIAWLRRNPMLGFGLGIILASSLAWAADTKISALTATTDFLGSKLIPAVNVTNTSNESWQVKQIGGTSRLAKTANYTVVAADRAKTIAATSGTFTLTLTAAATLGDGWWAVVVDEGTGVVTIDPNAAETIDGLTTATMYQGESRIIYTDGSNWFSVLEHGGYAAFTANGSFIVPAGATFIKASCWGAGGDGGGGQGAGAASTARIGGTGGGGASYVLGEWPAATVGSPGATVTVTVAAQGAATASDTTGNAGANTTFGTLLTGYGGGGGQKGTAATSAVGGTGAGTAQAGTTGSGGSLAAGGNPGRTAAAAFDNSSGGRGAPVNVPSTSANGAAAEYGGGAGGGMSGTPGTGGAGGKSMWGGGGGGSGGGVTTANGVAASGAGGDVSNDQSTSNGGGGAAGTGGVTGGAGTAGSATTRGGQGGGGGGSSTGAATVGGAGGDGGAPGGGGGGGGAGTGANGGTGGKGARGECRVWYS